MIRFVHALAFPQLYLSYCPCNWYIIVKHDVSTSWAKNWPGGNFSDV